MIDLNKIQKGALYHGVITLNSLTPFILAADATSTSVSMASLGIGAAIPGGSVKYNFKLILFVNETTTADSISIDFNGGTAVAASFRAQPYCTDSAALQIAAQTTALATAITPANFNGAGTIVVDAYISSADGGTFIPRFAQKAHSTGTATVFAGSRLVLSQ